MTDIPAVQSVQAILLFEGKYALQLRDDKPNIAAPGQWSLFGGMKKDGELPLHAIKREIIEELSITPPRYDFLWFVDYMGQFEKEMIRSWFFVADVSDVWSGHILREGQAVQLYSYNETANLIMPPVMRETIKIYENNKSSKGIL